MSQFVFSRLNWDDKVDFDCKDQEVNEYFQRARPASQDGLYSVTYRLATPDYKDVALVSLANNYFQGFDEHSGGPSVNINALGVNEKFQNQKIGRNLIRFLQAFFVINNKTGCRFMTLQATNNPRTIGFYENYCHFTKTGETGTATIPMYYDLIDTKKILEADPVLLNSYGFATKQIMHTGSTPLELQSL